ncbi:MAG: hypothetical protein ACRDYA_16900 [Egibacteraceae bacterium]
MARKAGKARPGAGSFDRLPDKRWRGRLSVGPRGAAKVFMGYGDTLAQAEADLARKVAAYERQLELGDAAAWTVADMLDWFVDEWCPERVADRRLAATTYEGYERAVLLHLRPRLTGVLLPR